MALLALLSATLLGQAAVTRIGLSLNVPEGGGAPELIAGVRQQIRMGLNGGTLSLKWNEIEPNPGQFELKALEDRKGTDALLGTQSLITLQTIDTSNRTIPGDLQALPWNDPVLIGRFEKIVEKVCREASPEMKWISLGNEVDVYLASHFSEVETYRPFLAAGRRAAKRVRPDIKVGVTTTWSGLASQSAAIRSLQEGMDATVFTYYGVGPDFQVLAPASITKALDEMLAVAGTRPLLLQEVGYPASDLLGGGEAGQSAFIKGFFDALRPRSNRIALAVWFIQVDFSPPLVDLFQSYYGLKNERFAAFLGTLGLRDSKGKPRQGWKTFQDEVRRFVPED